MPVRTLVRGSARTQPPKKVWAQTHATKLMVRMELGNANEGCCQEKAGKSRAPMDGHLIARERSSVSLPFHSCSVG